MKKYRLFRDLFYRSLKKTFLIMRIAIIFVILGIPQAYAFNSHIDRKINLDPGYLTILPVEQQRIVNGTITDSKTGESLPGVNITLKGTTNGTSSDLKGGYSITVPDANSVLVFSYIGYTPQEVVVGNKNNINVVLEEKLTKLNEIVIIGYGSVRRNDLTGAVSQVTSNDFARVPATNPLQALQGRASGLQIIPNSGEPGADMSIQIRGVQTINGSRSPIYVVDGIITESIANINPQDIESISVMKDASTVAIYGSRASNGVILVTTKRGSIGQALTITFETYQGVQTRSNLKIRELNSSQFLEIYTEAYANAGITPPWTDADLAQYNGISTDWQKAIMRTGYISNYNLSVSGGSNKSNYFVSAGYLKNTGMVIGEDYSKINFRINTDHKINNWIKFGNSLNIYSSRLDGSVGQYLTALQKVPLTRVYEDNGSWGVIRNTDLEHMYENPVWVAENCTNVTNVKGMIGNLFLTLSPLKGLAITARTNLEWSNGYNDSFQSGRDPSYHWQGSIVNSVSKANDNTLHWINDLLIDYNRKFADNHNVSALFGYSSEQYTTEHLYASRLKTPSDAIRFLDAGDPASQINSNSYSEWAFSSLFGRIGYTYKEKYILYGTVRRDGTSRLNASQRYGIFPSVSGAWRITKESFMKSLGWLNELKLRASWGVVGNVQSIDTYGTISSLTSLNYVMNEAPAQGYGLSSAVNSDLKWESTQKKDLGLDITVLNDKLYLISDFFIEDTHNLLFNQPIPASTGLSGSPYINAGHIRNKGVEFEIGFRQNRGNWNYNVSANFTHVKNEVVDLGGRDLRTSGIVVGYPLNEFFGYKTNGLIRTQDDLVNHPQYASKGVGDIWFLDVDGLDANGKLTGKPDGKVDASDRELLGSPFPKLVYGMMGTVGYKNFTLQVQLSGIYGVHKNLYLGGTNVGVLSWMTTYAMNNDVLIMDRFEAAKNPNGKYPKVDKASTGNNFSFVSDFWIRDASYLRVSNINLNYNIAPAFLKTIGIRKLDAYVSVQNLYTFTKFYGPEVDSNDDVLTGVPQPRTWTIGLRAAF